MLKLPKSTELNKQLPKKSIYEKFQISAAAKERIDSDISRITIVNELSPARINIAAGEKITSFYVLLISLKKKEFDKQNIIAVSKLIPQNILLILEHKQEAKLAVYYKTLIQTEWTNKELLSVDIKGLNFDKVWENIITEIGKIEIKHGRTLDEQIAANERRQKIEREIARLEKRKRAERQPKKKYDLFKKINALKAEVENG